MKLLFGIILLGTLACCAPSRPALMSDQPVPNPTITAPRPDVPVDKKLDDIHHEINDVQTQVKGLLPKE